MKIKAFSLKCESTWNVLAKLAACWRNVPNSLREVFIFKGTAQIIPTWVAPVAFEWTSESYIPIRISCITFSWEIVLFRN